jgi:hypothetical protein
MTYGSKLLFSIAVSIFAATSPGAAEFTYKEYKNASESWKRGFVFGISQYMSTVAQPDEEAPYPVRHAFQRCFAASTDILLVSRVDGYVARNIATVKGPMVPIVIRALFELCRAEIERVRLPDARPSRK